MANVFLATPNHADGSSLIATVLSAGAWVAALPLDNLKDRLLSKVARSADAALASTWFDIDLGKLRPVRMIGIPRHSISRLGRIRWLASTTAGDFGDPVHEMAWQDVWPRLYPWGTVPYGHGSWWDGKLSDEDAVGYNIGWYHVLAAPVTARWWRCEIDDQGNPDGYVDLARLFMAPGWQPSFNMSYRATLDWHTDTQVSRSLAGVDFFDRRESRRKVRFNIEYLPEDEAMAVPFEIQRRLGIDGEFYFIFDPEDTFHRVRRGFLARQERDGTFSYPVAGRNSISVNAVEVT